MIVITNNNDNNRNNLINNTVRRKNMKRHLITAMLTLAVVAAAPLAAQDADQLYRNARTAMNRQDFSSAIQTFRHLRSNYPDSRHVADSYYWEAFSLEREGNLTRAVAVIDVQMRQHADASTINDARALRTRICGELARRGDGECAAAISTTVRDESQVDESTRLAALNALMNMSSERAMPIARRTLENRNHSTRIRRQAVFIIADKGEPEEAREILLSVARDESDDPEVRAQAVYWLSEVEGEETLDALAELMQGSGDSEIKQRAIFAISQHDSRRALELLMTFARDTDLDMELRRRAIFWIGEEGEQVGLGFLQTLYGEVSDDELKERIIFAIAQTDVPEAMTWLMDRFRDQNEHIDVRKRALFWAADEGLTGAQLGDLYDSSDEREIREHLIWLIADSDADGSIDKLIDIARNDPDTELREKAIFWLGDSDDPRAAEYLLELLEG